MAKDIAFYPPIDSTILDDREHFLSSLIAHLTNHEKLEDILQRPAHTQDKEGDINDYFKILESLGDSIDGIHNSQPLTGLERISDQYDSLALEQRLHQFFQALTRLLGVKILLLPIDDVDMAAERGTQVLDVLRRYLASPFLLPVLTGHTDLYNRLLNKDIQEKFGISKDPYAYEQLDQANKRIIDYIRESYYSKLFPLHNRIPLHSVGKIVQQNTILISLHTDAQEQKIPALLLEQVANHLSRLGLEEKYASATSYIRYFSRSTRDYVHLLYSTRAKYFPIQK